MSSHQGKIVLITGGTTGIGKASARLFHEAGARVFATGRNPETLATAKKELPAGVTVLQADSSSLEDLDRLIASIKRQAGRLDVLFINAGIAPVAPVESAGETHWDSIMNVNLKGPFFLVQKALPLMSAGSSILFTTSIVNRKAFPGFGAYSASKAGLAGLARVIAAELAPKGIRVNCISPGPIETPIFGKMGLPQEALDQFGQGISRAVPLQRFGKDEEIAKAALFLASDAASFITAEEVVVDGGLVVA